MIIHIIMCFICHSKYSFCNSFFVMKFISVIHVDISFAVVVLVVVQTDCFCSYGTYLILYNHNGEAMIEDGLH